MLHLMFFYLIIVTYIRSVLVSHHSWLPLRLVAKLNWSFCRLSVNQSSFGCSRSTTSAGRIGGPQELNHSDVSASRFFPAETNYASIG